MSAIDGSTARSTGLKSYPHQPSLNSQKAARYSEAIKAIGNSTQHKKSFLEEFRMNLKKGLNGSQFGKLYQTLQIALSIVSCLECIAQTYIRRHNPDYFQLFESIEIAFVIVFMADWTVNFFLADHAINFFFR